MKAHKGFGDRLAQERREKSARERRDILQRDVAKAIGTSGATVSRWEDGDVMPRDDMMERLAAYFGVTPSWLRYGQAPREPETRGKGSAPPMRSAGEIERMPEVERPVITKRTASGGRKERR